MAYRPLLRLGERDAFLSYQFRSGIEHRNSWQVAAEMQHHGVPTRLLDWTDIFVTALYFALKNFRIEIEKYWFDTRKASGKTPGEIPFPPDHVFETLPKPCIWILNPYYLARFSSKRDRIWDLTLDPSLDYYNCFIEQKKWPFEWPIPIYSPWRTPRIAAQQGMFLVWGYDLRPLDDILREYAPRTRFMQKIEIDPNAAVFGVRHIRQLFGLDRHSMYRDLDALGAKTRREYLHDHRMDPKDNFD